MRGTREKETGMKHLIIFLDYGQSRLDNAVYKQFSQTPDDRRDVALLFIGHPLEERELQHEVSNLQRKGKNGRGDITFHLCADFGQKGAGANVVQTARMVRQFFLPKPGAAYRILSYSLLPAADECNAARTKTVWDNLASVSNAVTEYRDFPLLNQAFLYHDQTQQSLADFLCETIRFDISFDGPHPACHQVEEESLFAAAGVVDPAFPSCEEPGNGWPPVFAAFGASSVTWPESAVQEYFHRLYTTTLLRYALVDNGGTTKTECHAEAERILSLLPLQDERICLREETLFDVREGQRTQNWDKVDVYWAECIGKASRNLKDIPRTGWTKAIRQSAEAYFKSKFRGTGVDYFFQLQSGKSAAYVEAFMDIIGREFRRTVQEKAYTPEMQKHILRSIVNLLQQKVLKLQESATETGERVAWIETRLQEIAEKWEGMKMFTRLIKKDDSLFTTYVEQLTDWYIQRTYVPGYSFAIQLLNELIPSVLAMVDECDHKKALLEAALASCDKDTAEADPAKLLDAFSQEQVETAARSVADDAAYFAEASRQVVRLFYDAESPIIDAGDLLARVRLAASAEADTYLRSKTEAGLIPPVLFQPITTRLHAEYADRGGLTAFVDELKARTELHLALKAGTSVTDYYMLVAPQRGSDDTTPLLEDKKDRKPAGKPEPEMRLLETGDISHIGLLHLEQGIRLTELDGFSGQKTFIEPTLF